MTKATIQTPEFIDSSTEFPNRISNGGIPISGVNIPIGRAGLVATRYKKNRLSDIAIRILALSPLVFLFFNPSLVWSFALLILQASLIALIILCGLFRAPTQGEHSS